jgi:ABC-type Fe3+ transport system permease subunit
MDSRITKHPLHILLYFGFFILIVLPVIFTIGDALFTFDFSGLQKRELPILLSKSLVLALAVSLLSTVFGSILAVLIYKTDLRFRSFFKIALLIPLLLSPYIFAVAWKDFFFMIFHQTKLLHSYFGVLWVQSLIFTPLSMIIVGSALSNIDRSLEEAGWLITGKMRIFFRIILALIKPALLTSFVLVFILSISDFAVPAFFELKVLTTEIFTQFAAFYNHSLAILQSLILIIICLILLYSERKHLSDATFLSMGSKGLRTKKYHLGQYQKIGFSFVVFWLIISVALPFLVLFYQSFKTGTAFFLKAFELLLPTFVPSILLATVSAVIITIIGFASATFPNQLKIGKLDHLLLFTFAVPSTVFGISLIKFYNSDYLHFIYASAGILIIGYLGKFSFIASKFIGNSLKQIPKSLDEAALIAGISARNRKLKILFPLLSSGLFAAFLVSFIFVLGELGTGIMLYPPGSELMPIKVYTIMANAPLALTASMSLIVFAVSLILIGILYFVTQKFILNDRT